MSTVTGHVQISENGEFPDRISKSSGNGEFLEIHLCLKCGNAPFPSKQTWKFTFF